MLLCNHLRKKEKPPIFPNLFSREEMGKECRRTGEGSLLLISCGLCILSLAAIRTYERVACGEGKARLTCPPKASKVLGVQASWKKLSAPSRETLTSFCS